MPGSVTPSVGTMPLEAGKPEFSNQNAVEISVPVAALSESRYRSQHIDTDLTHTQAKTSRRIQDGILDAGRKCNGPADVFRYLLDEIGKGLR